MSSTIAYSLPFSFSVPPAGSMGQGGDFALTVTFDSPPADSVVQVVAGVVTTWFLLGTTGAMSGARVLPTTDGLRDLQPLATPRGLQWKLSGVALDDRAAHVLASLLLVAGEQIDDARIGSVWLVPFGSHTQCSPITVDGEAWDVYPPAARAAFPCHLDAEPMEEVAVQLEFKQPLSEEQGEAVRNELLVWAAAVFGGAYGIAPSSPSECGCVVDDEIEVVVDEVVLSLSQFRAHPGALDGLVSLCARIDATCAPLASVAVD